MKNNLFLCKATLEQLDLAVAMIEHGRSYLKNQGVDQWQNGYPDRQSIFQDLTYEKGYFLTDGEHNLAYLCMDLDGEPAYDSINGNWLTTQETKYLVIHRLAFHEQYRGKGLALVVFQLAEQFCQENGIGSIRVDTDPDNKIMQHLMSKAGFTRCGTIYFAGSDKIAFEKIIQVR